MLFKNLCLMLSAAILAAAFVLAFMLNLRRKRSNRVVKPFYCVAVGTFLSATALFLPYYSDCFAQSGAAWFMTALSSVYNAIRLFVVDCDFDMIRDAAEGFDGAAVTAYSVLGAVLCVLAPLLTFSFVLSFFRNASAYRRLLTGYSKPMYVFSAVNERSIAIARSVRNSKDAKTRRALIVFADRDEGKDSGHSDMLEREDGLDAVFFCKDVLDVRLNMHSAGADVRLFVVDDDDSEKIRHASGLVKSFGKRANATLYLLSDSAASGLAVTDMILPVEGGGRKKPKMRIRRINDARVMLEQNAYYKGERIFASANEGENGGDKVISAVVVGCGAYGSEMVKMLPWLCQMDGYRFKLNVFDSDPRTRSRFTAQCPSLMSKQYNGNNERGMARYSITFHEAMDVSGTEFADRIRAIGDITYVFVALGNDEANISVATSLRTLFERMGIKPFIQTPVYDPALNKAVSNARTRTGGMYDIDFIADLNSFYSIDVLCGSELEQEAERRHRKYDKTLDSQRNFYAYEYNYRSSVASAIHNRLRCACKLPGAEQPSGSRSIADRDALRRLEHERWCAYILAEGYAYSGSTDVSTRNDIAKLHNYLVGYDLIPSEIRARDDID